MKCAICQLPPDAIEEYVIYSIEDRCTPEEAVINLEGTLNPRTGLFYCTKCYLEIGHPMGVA